MQLYILQQFPTTQPMLHVDHASHIHFYKSDKRVLAWKKYSSFWPIGNSMLFLSFIFLRRLSQSLLLKHCASVSLWGQLTFAEIKVHNWFKRSLTVPCHTYCLRVYWFSFFVRSICLKKKNWTREREVEKRSRRLLAVYFREEGLSPLAAVKHLVSMIMLEWMKILKAVKERHFRDPFFFLSQVTNRCPFEIG